MSKMSTLETVGTVLTAAAACYGDRTAYIDHGRTYSFRTVDNVAHALADRLVGLGIAKGDRIAVIALNQIEWLYAYFAAAKLGVVLVALNARYRDNELDYMLRDSQAKAVISLGEHGGFDYVRYFAQAGKRFPDLIHHFYLGAPDRVGTTPFSSLIENDVVPPDRDWMLHAVGPDDPLMIIYTSGTTGKPKGAVLTHGSILASARAQAEHIRITPDDLTQLASPFNHVGGITCGIMTFLLGGATCELVPVFKTETVLQMAAHNPPTIISGVPTMLTLLLQSPMIAEVDFSNVRLVFTGGSNVDDTLLLQLQAVLPNARLMNLYGLTEASGAIVMTPWDCDRKDLLSSIGKPLRGAEMRLVRPNGESAAAGETGELWFKGLGVIHGYIGGEDNAQTFDSEGWLHTGDLAQVDQRGFIFLIGRQKDMYIQGGFNVYPVEIENVIAAHPEVLIVAGIGVPDPILGEIGRYYVVRKPASALSEQDVIEFCRTRVANYKVPRQVIFRDDLPTTPAGKIQKSVLRNE